MTVVEYIAGRIFIIGMNIKLWDYSDEWGNIQGIICPLFSFFWGLIAALYYFFLHPHILNAVYWLADHLTFSFFIGFFYGVFVIDCVVSFNLMNKVKKFAKENDLIVRVEELKSKIDNWMKHQPAYQPLADSIARKKTLVVIFCESLESWAINRKVEGKEITPNLNRYIADSHTLYAPHVLTQVKGGRSIDGQLLVSTGLLPLMSGCYAMQFPFTHYPSLVKAMKEEHPDLSSYLMTVDKPITWNQSVVAENFGISQMFFNDQWVNDEKVGSRKKLGDVSFMKQIVAKLKKGGIMKKGKSNYLQIVTYSGHNPFVLPDNLKRIHFKGDYPEKMRDFMIMANYTDHGLGILLDYLKSRPDYKDMMIVIIGDHEGLAADRKPICESPAAKGIVSDKQFTPFIVVNAPVGGIYNKVMGQVDQYPTILNLMHLDHYKWKGMGQSIFDPRKYPAAVGSDNMNVETTGNVPEKEIKRLTQAHRISDFLIRYDKIIK